MIDFHHAASPILAGLEPLATMDDFHATSAWIAAHYILIPVLAMGVVVLVALTLFTLSLVRIAQRKASLSLEARRSHVERFRADGRPYPPAGRGMCDRCEKAFDKVYHMPAGNRLCPECFQQAEDAGCAVRESTPAAAPDRPGKR